MTTAKTAPESEQSQSAGAPEPAADTIEPAPLAEPVAPAAPGASPEPAASPSLGKEAWSYAKVGLPVAVVVLTLAAGAVLSAAAAILVLAASSLVAVIVIFWQSIRTLFGETALSAPDAYALGAPRAEEEQKQAVLRALKDLEFERSVGKISEEDYKALVAKYRAEAKRLLRLLDVEAQPGREHIEALVAKRLRREGLLDALGGEGSGSEAKAPAVKSREKDGSQRGAKQPAAQGKAKPQVWKKRGAGTKGAAAARGKDTGVTAQSEDAEAAARSKDIGAAARDEGTEAAAQDKDIGAGARSESTEAAARSEDDKAGQAVPRGEISENGGEVEAQAKSGKDESDAAADRACRSCGTINDEDAVFCKKCGARQKPLAEQQARGEAAPADTSDPGAAGAS
jgi:ribosomal protein L40E